ncbi:hypothetical protein GQ53DRAFT_667085, partial [Thozetella sp. PMI_491]
RIVPFSGYPKDNADEYAALTQRFNLPSQFTAECDMGLTHSFGTRLAHERSETMWMHFLVEYPGDLPQHQPRWLRSGLVMTWDQPDSGGSFVEGPYSVRLIVFSPPAEMLRRLSKFIISPQWKDATIDPYVLIDLALFSWYETVDRIAWLVTKRVRADEVDIFSRAQNLRVTQTRIKDLDLGRIHTNAKNAIFMIEGLDAAIRLVSMALLEHESLPERDSVVWRNTHRSLRHQSELFHSSRLRTLSSRDRIKNTTDLAFHIGAVHDSRIGLRDSRSMRIISIVGTIFIPFSAISSVFGTQFFTSVGPYMYVNPEFWILWAIAMPITLTVLIIWLVWEQWDWCCSRLVRVGLFIQRQDGEDEETMKKN